MGWRTADTGWRLADRGPTAAVIASGTTIDQPTLVSPALSGTMTGAASSRIKMPSGTKTLPSYGFTADDDAGVYYAAGVAITMADTLVATFKAAGLDVTPTTLALAAATLSGIIDGRATAAAQLLLPAGSAAAPALAMGADGNDGFYQVSDTELGVAVEGARLGGPIGKVIDRLADQSASAAVTISLSSSLSPIVEVWIDAGATMVATPTFQAGQFAGQIMIVCKTTDAGTLIFSDRLTIPGSGMALNATTVTMTNDDKVAFIWDAEQSLWVMLHARIAIQ